MRKRAVQASRFMLQMMQAPLYEDSVEPPLECGEEGLAIRIAIEVSNFPNKKTFAYISAISKILVMLHFRSSEQDAIKLMRRILDTVTTSVSTTDRDLIKELKRMVNHLSEVDRNVDDEQLPAQDQANLIFGRLEVDFNLDPTVSDKTIQSPIPRSTKPKRGKRQVRQQETSSSSEEEEEEEEEERSPTSIVPVNRQSERASKTAALSKITASRAPKIAEEEEEEESEVTSDESDQVSE
ncbi:hypothetical protein CsatA_022576 [Cannabis sativa]